MDTKTALLNSAERLVRTRGFDAISFADIAQEVGIRKASIHHHFPTKAALATRLLDRYSSAFFEELDRISAVHTTPQAQLSAFVDVYRDALGDGSQICLCVSFSAARDSFDEAVLSKLAAFQHRCLGWLESVFASADVPMANSRAAQTLAVVEGAHVMVRASQDILMFDRAVHALTDI